MLRRLSLAAALGVTAGLGGPAQAQDDWTPIYVIQGRGSTSPLVGQVVTTRGVVTATFPGGANDLNGFFVQDPVGDGDPGTSDGIFVYDNRSDSPVSLGALVRVTGEVKEHFGLTEILLGTVETVEISGPEVPFHTVTEIPCEERAAALALETLEGMRVRLTALKVVGATDHYGEAFVLPAGTGRAALYRNDLLGCRLGLLRPTGWLALDQGQQVLAAEGVVAYTYGVFKLAMANEVEVVVTPTALRPPPPPAPAAPDEITIVTYNVENFFDDVDTAGKEDPVPTAAEYAAATARRARSIARDLGAPDIVALQEVENLAVLEALVNHPLMAGAGYRPVHVEGPDLRGIDVALLFRESVLRLAGEAETRQACTARGPAGGPGGTCTLHNGGEGWLLFSRPPLVVTLWHQASGQHLVLIINHFKSKSGGDSTTEPYRVEQAEWVRSLAIETLAANPATKLVVLGDLNDFEDSQTLKALTMGGRMTSLWSSPAGPDDFTYNYRGVRQILDFILMPPGQAYRDFRGLALNTNFAAPAAENLRLDVQHVGDHDPVFVRLVLDAPAEHHLYLPSLMRAAFREGIGGGAETTPTPDLPGTSPTAPPTITPSATRPNQSPTPVPTAIAPGGPPRFPLRIDHIHFDGDINPNEPDEYIAFTNVAEEAVDLTGWQLISVQGNQRYRFPTGKRINAGQTCRIYTNEYHEPWCGLNWGSGSAIWANGGDKAELRNAAGLLVDHACYGSWGGECP